MSVEEYWRLYSIWRPRPEDVCNSEILQLPTVQWRADAVPASGYYQNVDIPAGEFICVFSDRVYAWQPFTENGAWNINARCRSGLTLTPAPNQSPPDPRPKGTEGKEPKSSTHELIATVTENGSPKAGVAVTFKVEVKEGSGEHGVTGGAVHDHRFRVKDHSGKVPPSGMTKANGEVSIKFEAPILAGTHTITATCETCSNKTATKDVKVLVPDLVDLPSDTKKPKTFELVGADSSTGKNHPDNHYFTTAARDTLVNGVIPRLYKNGWGVVGVNDGSLKDGGLFDLEGKWVTSGGHAEHRKGTEVDIRTRDNSPKMVQDGYDALCDKEQAALGIQTLWHKKDGYGAHFHIYLSGIGLRADAIGGCCTSVIGPKKNKDGTPLLDKQGNPIKGAICE